MSVPDNTPVIIGVGTISQRQPDVSQAAEASQLMIQAAEAAARDAGTTDALSQLDMICAMSCLSTGYLNPAKLVAEAVGSPEAHTLRADPGILQQEIFSRVGSAIQKGEMEIALVVGGEASYRKQQAGFAGIEATNTDDRTEANEPDTALSPSIQSFIHPLELEAGLASAISQYSMLENAYRHHHQQTKAEQAQETAELWARFSQVAVGNPDAWNQQPVSAHDIATPSSKNRMIAFPYTKNHCSQMNVDQAAAVLFCSAGKARSLGIAPDRWIFPHAGIISNHIVTVLPRAEHHASPGFRCAGQRLTELCGVSPQDVGLIDLYSCFPVAVKIQANELGLPLDRQLTVTGGMTFAGGPFNSYVLNSLCKMVEQLRQQPEALGLVNTISGMVTKQGLGLLAAEPPEGQAYFEEVTSQVSQLNSPLETDDTAHGKATAVTYTVLHERVKSEEADSTATGSVPTKAIVIAEFSRNGTKPVRRLAATTEPEIIQAVIEADEFCHSKIHVSPEGSFSLA